MSELFNLNVKNINNYANFKLENDSNEIKQFRSLFSLIRSKVYLMSSSAENFLETSPALISLIVLNCI